METDKIVNIYEIDKFEDENKIKFPEKYKQFLQKFGGDYYMFGIEEGRCLEPLYFYEHDTGVIGKTEYADIL